MSSLKNGCNKAVEKHAVADKEKKNRPKEESTPLLTSFRESNFNILAVCFKMLLLSKMIFFFSAHHYYNNVLKAVSDSDDDIHKTNPLPE